MAQPAHPFRFLRGGADGWLPAALLLAVVLIYGRYLPKDHFTASGDFPPAVSYALNYRLAVEDGQWLPRLVVIPRDVSLGLGSIDGTEPTADAPDFQYYGFLQSALAYPFLRLGLPAIKAVQMVVILAFGAAVLVLYAAGRTFGARPLVACMAAYAYIVSPWLVSNFYGRGGISEVLGQAGLTPLILALAWLSRSRCLPAVLATAASFVVLALGHNIYLLYGGVLCGLFGLGFLLCPVPASGGADRGDVVRWRAPLALAAGAVLGLALTAWQWLPALQTLGETSFQYFGAFSAEGRVPKNFTDWSGALGVPRQFVEPWSGQRREFFFTVGWWILPGLVALVRVRREFRPASLALGLGFVVFAALMMFPDQIYPHLPGAFGATQYTFRLLSFLSLLGSFAWCLALPELNRWWVAGMVGLMTLSQWPVITFPMAPAGGITPLHEEQYRRGYEYNAFYANSPNEKNLRYWYDGWMQEANQLDFSQCHWHQNGRWRTEPATNPSRGPLPVTLRIRGRLADGLEQTALTLVTADGAARPVSAGIAVVSRDFDVTLQLLDARVPVRLAAEPTVTTGGRKLSIKPSKIQVMWGHPRSLIPAEDVATLEHHGYRRVFVAQPEALAQAVTDHTGAYTVEIPMVYSRFLRATQEGETLATTVDLNHRLNVRTIHPAAPIRVDYRLPGAVWWLTGAGVIATGICGWQLRRSGSRLVQDGRHGAGG